MIPNIILKVLVGSRAHGLHTPESDYDYRMVYVDPTEDVLSLNYNTQGKHSIQDEDDNQAWEIKHFLQMALKSNPTVLEVLTSPVIVETTPTGHELLDLLDAVWTPQCVYKAYQGFGRSQAKKFHQEFRSDHMNSQEIGRFAANFVRTMIQGVDLLTTGSCTPDVSQHPLHDTLVQWRQGIWSLNDIEDQMAAWKAALTVAYERAPEKEPDYGKVNTFLLNVRKQYWSHAA